MIAKLVDPQMDKNFSIQFFKVTDDDRKNIYKNFHQSCKIFGHQFMQGDYDDWMMIEFWTDNVDLIIQICIFYQNALEIEIEGF